MTIRTSRRQVLISASAFTCIGAMGARAQTPGGAIASGAIATNPQSTNWLNIAADSGSTRYAPLDQINASNFNHLEVAWRLKADNFGPGPDAYFSANATPLVVNGRLFTAFGTDRYLVSLDAATGQMLWMYRHNEGARRGARPGSGWGISYWTDGTKDRILYVTRSYQLVSVDAKTGMVDPTFGVNGEVDLRLDWDHDVHPTAPVVGLHAPPLIVRQTVVVGAASAATGPGYLRGFDVRTGKRKWIFHTVPRKGEFGYETWLKAGQSETATNTGVWAPMSGDAELGLVYAGVELPQADWLGLTREGDALFSETLVALDCETGERRWHYQTEHHGLWDRDIPAAPVLLDIRQGGKVVKALAQPTKQAFLFVLDRQTGKPIWPIREVKVPAGDVPGEWYAPTQPVPSKPPAYDRQGFSADDLIDWTPEIKARALEIMSHYKTGPLYTPPSMVKPDGPWGTLHTPENQGATNWPGGSADPETGVFYIFSQSTPYVFGIMQAENGRLITANSDRRGTNDNMGGSYGGSAYPNPRSGNGGPVPAGTKDGLNDPIRRGVLTINGLAILKPPYGRITAIDLNQGTQMWQVAHGETPDYIKNNPLLKGVNIPRTGQSGFLGVLTTKSLVICGDAGLFTDDQGRKAARLRAYDKRTGEEVGAVFMDQAQTGSPMTYMVGGRQHIVVPSAGFQGAELICYRLPSSNAAAPSSAPE